MGDVGTSLRPSSLEMNRYVLPISFLLTLDTSPISSSVLGTLHCLHAEYKAAAATPSMLLPRIRFLSTAFRYTTAAVSLTFCDNPSADAILSSSESAKARFLSVALLTRIRRCHFLSLYNWALLLLDMDFPYESRFLQSIIVDNPLSVSYTHLRAHE